MRWAALLMLVAGAAAAADGPAAVSGDGRWLLRPQGQAVELQQAGGGVVRRYAARSLDGRETGTPRWWLALPQRASFLVVFDGLAEAWELLLDPRAEPIHHGLVHDFRMGEGIAEPGYLGIRRTRLPEALQALAVGADGGYVLGRGADAADGRAVLHLVQLDVRRAIARFVVQADPDLGRAEPRVIDGREHLVVPDRRGGAPLAVDLRGARLRHE